MDRRIESPEEFETLIGATLGGRFRALEPIGEGAMSVVVKAEHVDLGYVVAIKVLRSEFLPDRTAVKRFRLEARAVSRISHRNIVYLSDFGQCDDGRLFIVMEYIDGETLRVLMERKGALGLGRALRVLVQIAEALQAAHAHRIVHRDLKPENIVMVHQRGRGEVVKVLDFGLAKILRVEGEEGTALTQTGQTLGTPVYMSPEQCAAEPVGMSADLYTLGVLAFELAVGRPPFQGQILRVMYAHQAEEPPKPSDLNPELAAIPAFDAFVMRCLRKKPEERFTSADEALAALIELSKQLMKHSLPSPVERGDDGLVKAPQTLGIMAVARKRAEGELEPLPEVIQPPTAPPSWEKHITRSLCALQDAHDELSYATHHQLNQVRCAAEAHADSGAGGEEMGQVMAALRHEEQALFELSLDAALMHSWAEEVEHRHENRHVLLRHAVIDLAQERDEMCEALAVPARAVQPAPLEGGLAGPSTVERQHALLADVMFQIRELERQQAALGREHREQLLAVDVALHDTQVQRRFHGRRQVELKQQLTNHVPPEHLPDPGSSPTMALAAVPKPD
ncbi:MAG: serine/threonine-protein kinase [bacterium]